MSSLLFSTGKKETNSILCPYLCADLCSADFKNNFGHQALPIHISTTYKYELTGTNFLLSREEAIQSEVPCSKVINNLSPTSVNTRQYNGTDAILLLLQCRWSHLDKRLVITRADPSRAMIYAKQNKARHYMHIRLDLPDLLKIHSFIILCQSEVEHYKINPSINVACCSIWSHT